MGQHVETNKMNFVVFFIGVVLGVIAITVMHWCRVAYERGTWAATMVAIAAFYMVFSIEHSLGETQHIVIALLFSLLAILGARFNTWLIVVALIGHGVFDAFVHLVFPDPSPEWWGPFCISVDIILGLWLAVLLVTKRIKVS